MRLYRILYSLVVACLLAFGNVAHAAVYDFGSLLTVSSAYIAPDSFASDPFVVLSTTDNGGGVWTMSLSINNNLFSNFGTGAFIDSMSFDSTPDPSSQPVSTFISSDGVTSVTSTSGTGGSGLSDIDFGTAFGQGASNRLSQNDWVQWNVSGLPLGSDLTNMYVHLQGIGEEGYSAKYTPIAPIVTAIPEPGTYAMLLAGLGLIGFSARHRKSETFDD